MIYKRLNQGINVGQRTSQRQGGTIVTRGHGDKDAAVQCQGAVGHAESDRYRIVVRVVVGTVGNINITKVDTADSQTSL